MRVGTLVGSECSEDAVLSCPAGRYGTNIVVDREDS